MTSPHPADPSPADESPPGKKAARPPTTRDELRTSNTADSAAQDPTLAGRLLLLRRVLLTAVEIIEDIALPNTGGTP